MMDAESLISDSRNEDSKFMAATSRLCWTISFCGNRMADDCGGRKTHRVDGVELAVVPSYHFDFARF